MSEVSVPSWPPTTPRSRVDPKRYSKYGGLGSDRKSFRNQPASPELLSSLISSLSAISTPVEDLYDTIVPVQDLGFRPPSRSTARPHSRATTRQSTSHSRAATTSHSNDHAAFRRSLEAILQHADGGAATPLVVRTVKPQATSARQRSRASSSALSSPRGLRMPTSIGKLSVERPPTQYTSSVRSGLSSGKASDNGQSSLKNTSSRERIRDIDRGRRRGTSRGSANKTSVPLPRSGSNSSASEPPVPSLSRSPPPSEPSPTRSLAVLHEFGPTEPDDLPPTVPKAGRIPIPTRESSIRRGFESSPSKARRKSQGSHRPSDSMEDMVSKRIRELKSQKELRDRLQNGDDDRVEAFSTNGDTMFGDPFSPFDRHIKDGGFDIMSGKGDGNPPGKLGPKGSWDPGLPAMRSQSMHQINQGSSVSRGTTSYAPLSKHRRTFSDQTGKGYPSLDRAPAADSIDDAVEEYLADPRMSQLIYHPGTGRQIAFSEVGDSGGYAVFCCVGMGTTRFVTAFYDELALTLGLRLITPERPGIGDSEAYADGTDTPLGWPDDIRLICQHLNINRFSLLAHSAGAIYALAAALRMPQHIRGRVHILAPWIPPSQLRSIGIYQPPVPVPTLPYMQRLLRKIPGPWLQAATNFFNVSSITTSLGKSPNRKPRNDNPSGRPASAPGATNSVSMRDMAPPSTASGPRVNSIASAPSIRPTTAVAEQDRASAYDERLTTAIWLYATSNANPAVDLVVCLERNREIGFRYEDITRPVVIHHGTLDTRVSVENVRWMGGKMRDCEVRILDGEGHGLMANAAVMGNLLVEIAGEWEAAMERGKARERRGRGDTR